MKAFFLFLAAAALSIAFLPSCQHYGPDSGYRDKYGNQFPNQHGRWKGGYRTHAEKKYMRPR